MEGKGWRMRRIIDERLSGDLGLDETWWDSVGLCGT